ncbi:MAG: glyoxalase III HchA [Candidatus Cyclobacteriaceae bacterium M3_2C_046]
MIKKLLGIAPKPTEDGAFSPSRLALKLATSSVTNYDKTIYSNPYQGKLKIMMICTEEKNMVMANGKKFSTGNHPVEMLVPMLHFKNAGFEVDIFTPTGQSVKIERWAMPGKDEHVKAIYSRYQDQFKQPASLNQFVQHEMNLKDEYIAIFIPGGHGAMLGLPANKDLKKLIQKVYQHELLLLAICHGPAALLSLSIDEDESRYPFKGYSIAAFPDKVDKQTPMIGYMPGHLTWYYGEKLKKLGVTIINKMADKSCFVDRTLVTGASPLAANDFGKLAVNELLQKVKK